jgi:hypothetical protein
VPIILAILLVVLNMHSLETSACPIYPMQKKKNTNNFISERGRGAWDFFMSVSRESSFFFKYRVDQKNFFFIHEIKDTCIRDLKKYFLGFRVTGNLV